MHAFLCVLALEKNTKLPLTSANMRNIHVLYNKLLQLCYETFLSNSCHSDILSLRSKNVTFHHRETGLLNWALQGIIQEKCCTASFRVHLDFCSQVETFQRNALANTSSVQFSVSSKSHGNFLVWIKMCACIWFVPECGTYRKWLRKKQKLLSGSSYLCSLTAKKEIIFYLQPGQSKCSAKCNSQNDCLIFLKTQAVISLAAMQMYIIVSEWGKSMMRPCEASKRREGKVWIRGILYGKHLHWSRRHCTFTVVWLRYLQNYMADAAPISHPACPGVLLWVIQGCKTMFRNTSPFPKAVTLFSSGYSKQTFETTVFSHQSECQLPPENKIL